MPRKEIAMDYDSAAVIGAGLIGGGAMVVPLYMGRVMMPKQMRMGSLPALGHHATAANAPLPCFTRWAP